MTDLGKIPEPLRSYLAKAQEMASYRVQLDDWERASCALDEGGRRAFWTNLLRKLQKMAARNTIAPYWQGMEHADVFAADWMPYLGEVPEREWVLYCMQMLWIEHISHRLEVLAKGREEQSRQLAERQNRLQQRLNETNAVLSNDLDLLKAYNFMWKHFVRGVGCQYEYMALYCFLNNNSLLSDHGVLQFSNQINTWYGDLPQFKKCNNVVLSPYSILINWPPEEWLELRDAPAFRDILKKLPQAHDNVANIRTSYLLLQSRYKAGALEKD